MILWFVEAKKSKWTWIYSSGWSLPKRLFRLFQSKKKTMEKFTTKNCWARTLYYISRSWVGWQGQIQVNRVLGIQNEFGYWPYKEAVFVHNTVNLSVLKFLTFEQVFKIVWPHCQWVVEKEDLILITRKSDGLSIIYDWVCRHIGPQLDVPAGDIGVGARNWLFIWSI
jgi:glutamate dehydrogenase/leucine dehydrogenase